MEPASAPSFGLAIPPSICGFDVRGDWHRKAPLAEWIDVLEAPAWNRCGHSIVGEGNDLLLEPGLATTFEFVGSRPLQSGIVMLSYRMEPA